MDIELLTPSQVEELLGVKPETLRSWRLKGIVKYYRINNTIRFMASDIMELLSRNKKNDRAPKMETEV